MKYSRTPAALLIASIAAAMLAACGSGGGSSSGGGGGSGGTTASGINGTGIARGAVERFGSIFVNGREFDTSGANFVIDDKSGAQADLVVGNVVEVKAKFNDDGSATALEVRYDAALEGPIATIDSTNNSFTVAGQTVLVSGTTVFEGTPGLAGLKTGDVVEVSGRIDVNGELRASSVELQQNPDTPNEVEVKGTVMNLDSANQTFDINALTVDYSSAVPDPVNLIVENGQFVEVSGTLNASDTLIADELELEDRVPVEEGDAVEIEGIVATVASASTFTLVSGLQVAHDSGTEFEDGTAADIKPGAAIEVAGEIGANGVLQAVKIELEEEEHEPAIEIAAEVDAVDPATDTITLLGGIKVQATDDTRIKDDRDGERTNFTVDDIQQGDYVEIAAVIDGNGDLIATRIERDEIESNTGEVVVELQGPLGSGETASGTIEVLGVTVDFGSAQFEDANDDSISQSDFFSRAKPGDLVEVQGVYNENLMEIEAREVSAEGDSPEGDSPEGGSQEPQ